MTTQQTAIVIDDHPLVARGIADFLSSHCAFTQVTAVTDIESFWKHLKTSSLPAIVVMDFWLPAGASLPLLSELKTKYPQLPILVISADDNFAVETKVRNAGAHGFLNKQEEPEMFLHAITAILGGNTWFHAAERQSQPKYQSNELPITAAELGLTARQGEILALVIQGLPNKRIARELNLAEQTVKEHVSGILERLEVNNRIALITKLRGKKLE